MFGVFVSNNAFPLVIQQRLDFYLNAANSIEGIARSPS